MEVITSIVVRLYLYRSACHNTIDVIPSNINIIKHHVMKSLTQQQITMLCDMSMTSMSFKLMIFKMHVDLVVIFVMESSDASSHMRVHEKTT